MQSCTEESVRESVSLCTLVSGPARPLHRVWIRCERLEGWNQRRNALFSFFFFTNVLNNLKCSMLPFRTVNTLLTFLHDTKYFVVTGISDESIAMCLFCVMCFFFLCNFNSNAFLLFFFPFHYLHCGVIDTVCLISAIHVFIKGNIAFPALCILFFNLEMHDIDQMFNKIAFTGQ